MKEFIEIFEKYIEEKYEEANRQYTNLSAEQFKAELLIGLEKQKKMGD